MTPSFFRVRKSPVLSLCVAALCAGLVSSQSTAKARSEKHIVQVQLPRSKALRAKALERLAQLDVMGVDTSHGIADVRVSPFEMRALIDAGLEVSFAREKSLMPLGDSLDRYFTPEALAEKLRALESTHRDLARVFSIGKTREGRDILAIELSRQNNDPAQKPAALFNALHHARELMTTEVAVDIAETLLEGYGKDAEVTSWLDSTRIIVVPQVNPDGNALVHKGDTMWRKNAWRKQGAVVGVDLNRNYPTLWGQCNGSSANETTDTYRGPNAASEPETLAMMELVKSVRPLVNISYHAFSEIIIYPFGCRSERNPSRDMFDRIGNRMRADLEDDNGRKGTYAVGAAPDVIYQADGTDVDWQWKEAGVVSFAMEVNSGKAGFQPNYDTWRDVTVKRQRGAWKALLRAMANGTVTLSASGFAPDSNGGITARIDRITRDARTGAPLREALDADAPNRLFHPRVQGEEGENPRVAFLLPQGSYEITLSDGLGATQKRTVSSRGF